VIVCYRVAMRVHITLADELVRELDRRVGARRRSAYITRAVERALEDDHRWELIESALGSISDGGHEWDEDAGRWVRDQRRVDLRRVG
jgi:hypothetical protein